MRTRTWTVSALAAAVAAVTLTGCSAAAGGNLNPPPASGGPATPVTPQATESNAAGDIPDNQPYVSFSPPGAPVNVKVPEGWARTTAGAVTSFTDKLNRIEISTGPAATAPTVASVQATDLPQLQASVPAFTPGQVSTVTRPAGPAVLVTYQGDSAKDPVTGKVVRDAFERYIFYRGGTRVDLTLAGPTNADNVDPWRTVTDSLQWQ